MIDIKKLITPNGVTVAQLKELLKDWPNTDANGDPTEVWIGTGPGVSSQCMEIWPLNMRGRGVGSSADMLLRPSEKAWEGRETTAVSQQAIASEVYYPDQEILGDGAHYTRVDGELVPLVSRSATDRLRHGDRRGLIITTYSDGHKNADLPIGRVDHLPHHTP